MDKKNLIIPLLVLTLYFPALIFAETVLLKSGKTVEGKIIEKTDKYIKIDFYGVPLTYFFDEIESIDGNKVDVSRFKEVAVDETDPNKIFEKVIAAYGSMQTYKAKGITAIDMDMGGMKMTTETEFSMLLKKPNLYLISWTQKMPGMVQAGAVWSDGTQPYLYMGPMNAYSKMTDDQTALGGATGISGGSAFTIPSLFLSVFKDKPTLFEGLQNPKVEGIEQVENEECYVISASSQISKKETLWISKSKYLIIKYFRSFEQPEGGRKIPEITDEQLEKTMKGMRQEITAENKQKMREEMNKSMEAFKNIKTEGSSTELHTQISSPEISNADFKFSLPPGTVYKESLLEGMMGGGKDK